MQPKISAKQMGDPNQPTISYIFQFSYEKSNVALHVVVLVVRATVDPKCAWLFDRGDDMQFEKFCENMFFKEP